MLLVGLTGGIASGKSTAAAFFQGLGCALVDADSIARQVVQPGSPGLTSLCRHFGRGILDGDGGLNRPRLGKIVFHDPKALARLNEILHPLIIREIHERVEEYRQKEEEVVLVDAPLLFETGLQAGMDCTVVVYAREATRLERLMERDLLSRYEAMLRLASQLSLEEKVRQADYVIDNEGSLTATEEQVKEIWAELKERAALKIKLAEEKR